jgi:hypothetical protein
MPVFRSTGVARLFVAASWLTLACSQTRPVDDSGGGGFGTGLLTGDESAGNPGESGSPGSGATTGNGSAADGETGIKLDVGPSGGDGPGPSSCGCGNLDWSYLWVANSGEGTVSKINTRTLEEEGRYVTHPSGSGDPSRTSVSLDGYSVVVANRSATGVAKIWAVPELCSDHNGTPGIQTSTGKNDVLPWGEDDCVAWFTEFPDMTVQRPIAWSPHRCGPQGELEVEAKVWTVTGANGSPGTCGAGGIWVHRLNGDTGVIEDTVHIPDSDFSCDITGLGSATIGPYGGAVDREGNFWFHGFTGQGLFRIDYDTLQYEQFSGGGYGITVDTKDRVWLSSSITRFEYGPNTAQNQGVSVNGGIAQDHAGRIWAADGDGVIWVDMETLAVGDRVVIPSVGGGSSTTVKGVSVDVDGFVWAIAQGDTRAYKIDPNTYDLEYYDGLDSPYTYSDMTGGAIFNVSCNPEG